MLSPVPRPAGFSQNRDGIMRNYLDKNIITLTLGLISVVSIMFGIDGCETLTLAIASGLIGALNNGRMSVENRKETGKNETQNDV